MGDATLDRFAAEVAKRELADLGRAALLLGAMARPELDVEAYHARLDDLGREARERGLAPVATIASLFGDDRFRGNSADYYDPRNSFLHEVLDRRLGIPITLAVLAIEVGRRAGIAVEGVPFPGHFLVRVRAPGGAVILDPFGGGEEVSDGELLVRLRAVKGAVHSLGPAELGAASVPQVLARMAQNLKVIYLGREDFAQALRVQERIVALFPDVPGERRDLGLILARLERIDEAVAALRDYLEQVPAAPDAVMVRDVADHLRRRRGPIN